MPAKPPKPRETTSPGAVIVGDPNAPLGLVEREHIRLVLQAVNGNQSEAARRLGIGRNTLARKLSGQATTEGGPVD